MKSLRWIPAIIALALLFSPAGYGQAAVQEKPAPSDVKGIVAVWRPDSGIILAEDVTDPVQFSFAKKVDCVDNTGKPVGREVIQPGDPVTIHYLREGDRLLVNRVTMERKPTPAPTARTNTETTTQTSTQTASKADESHVLKDLKIIRARIEKETRQLNEHHR